VGLQRFSSGKIVRRDAAGFEDGSFNPNDVAVMAGVAQPWNGYSLGASVKWIRSQIVNTAQTAAVDLGVLSPLYGGRMNCAFVVTNLGGKLTYDETAEKLPSAVTLGGSIQWTRHWLTALDLKSSIDNRPTAAIGTEYTLSLFRSSHLAFRAGYNSRTLNQVDGMTGVSLGMGFTWESVSLDYGFLPFGDLGFSNLFSVSAKFGHD
jgi:hypothetical protein